MADTGKRPGARPSKDRPGGGGHPIEKSPVEARQAYRGRPVLYVLIASLALLVAAFVAVATMIWVR